MNYQPINLSDKFAKFSEKWSPKIVAQMNDYHFKIARLEGEFIWHDHPETDEVFIVLKGQLEIRFHEGSVVLNEGEMLPTTRVILLNSRSSLIVTNGLFKFKYTAGFPFASYAG